MGRTLQTRALQTDATLDGKRDIGVPTPGIPGALRESTEHRVSVSSSPRLPADEEATTASRKGIGPSARRSPFPPSERSTVRAIVGVTTHTCASTAPAVSAGGDDDDDDVVVEPRGCSGKRRASRRTADPGLLPEG